MVQKSKSQKTYRTMQGKMIDMDMLRKRNELTPAAGNARVNARGDQLGPGGKIIRKHEELVKDYYENNKNVKSQSAVRRDQFQPPAEAIEETKDLVDDWEEPNSSDDWIEDDEGNFVKPTNSKKGK